MQEAAEYLLDPGNFMLFVIGALLLLLIMLGLLIRQSARLSRLDKKYRRLLGRAPEGNMEDILRSLHLEMAVIKGAVDKAEKNQQDLLAKAKTAVRGMSLVRYNAFQNTGSDLSFSLALLDETRDGIVLSAIYGREECRTYAKPIKVGRSSYHLSEEEEKALRQAEEAMLRKEGGVVLGQ